MRDPGANVPDAVFELCGERHAIEVELTPKSIRRLRLIVAEHCRRYDAVVYFCSPAVRRLFERRPELTESPNLFLRELPDPPRELSRAGWRCGEDPCRQRPVSLALHSAEVSLLSLASEQGALPLDQLPRLLGAEAQVVEAMVAHLHEAGRLRRARPLPQEPEWVWPSRRGAWACGSDLKPAAPRVGGLAMLRAVNEARIYVQARAPEARWIPRRILLRNHGRNASVPRGVVEIGSERHAIEVELRKRAGDALVRHYSRRCREYDAVVAFGAPVALSGLRRLAREARLPNLLVRPLPTARAERDSLPADARLGPVVLPVPVAELPIEALEAIRVKAGLDAPLRARAATRRFGSALWRIETAEHGIWRVHHGRFGWRATRLPQLRRIDLTEIRPEELAAIQRAIGTQAPPRVSSAHRHVGRGSRALRAATDAGDFRVAHTRWGWTAKCIDGFS